MEAQIPAESSGPVVFQISQVIWQDTQKNLEFSPKDGFDEEVSVLGKKEKTARLSLRLLRKHEFNVVDESVLKSVDSDGLQVKRVGNAKEFSDLIEYLRSVVYEMAHVEEVSV